MSTRPHILCPIDFSEPSRTALAYAAAIANHFGATLDVLAVDDPLLAEVASTAHVSLEEETNRELRRFCDLTLESHGARSTDLHVTTGKPAAEILRLAVELHADLIVMGSHGRSGVKRLFFGSTTERVLRETPVPVLITPDAHLRPRSLSDATAGIERVLAPVDFSAGTKCQVSIAGGIASALSAPLLIAHAIEPVFIPPALRAAAVNVDLERRAACMADLDKLAASVTGCAVEPIVVYGDAADEIVKLSIVRGAGLIVISLHSGGRLGPHMGSVTYRVLCQARRLILALPLRADAHTARGDQP
jgi:nucleotide-binding universal stress UspA family protein